MSPYNVYMDVNTKIYLLRGKQKMTQDIVAKNILDGRQTILCAFYGVPSIIYVRF
jgi:hypothetical protein